MLLVAISFTHSDSTRDLYKTHTTRETFGGQEEAVTVDVVVVVGNFSLSTHPSGNRLLLLLYQSKKVAHDVQSFDLNFIFSSREKRKRPQYDPF